MILFFDFRVVSWKVLRWEDLRWEDFFETLPINTHIYKVNNNGKKKNKTGQMKRHLQRSSEITRALTVCKSDVPRW
jgi:hypothetical protein